MLPYFNDDEREALKCFIQKAVDDYEFYVIVENLEENYDYGGETPLEKSLDSAIKKLGVRM
jgi:hypothetical protein